MTSNKVTFLYTKDDYKNRLVEPGEYTFTYQVTTDASVAALTKTFTFTLELTDVCVGANPTVTEPLLQPQVYTIADAAAAYSFDAGNANTFTIDLAYCYTDLTLASAPSALDTKLSLDEATQVVTIAQISDSLALAGAGSEEVYTITVKFTWGSFFVDAAEAEYTGTFTWTIKNPCVDPSKTYIIQGTDPAGAQDPHLLDDLTYVVYDDRLIFTGNVAHSVYSTVLYGLCDGLAVVYSAKFDGADIDASGAVMDFELASDPLLYTFGVDTDDVSLIDTTKDYSMMVAIEIYPTAPITTYSATVEF